MEPKLSIFSALRPPEEAAPAMPPVPGSSGHSSSPASAPPPPPPSAPAEASPALKSRLEELEKRLTDSQSGADARAFRLEAELRLAREEAVSAMTMLRGREEAQKSAQAEMEKLLRTISEQKRSEEHDRLMRDQISSQKKRIDDLETMLIENRKSSPAVESREAVERAYLEIESLRSEIARLRAELHSSRDGASERETGGERERDETRRRLAELEKKAAQPPERAEGPELPDVEALRAAAAKADGWEARFEKLAAEFGRLRDSSGARLEEAHRLAEETLAVCRQTAALQTRATETDRAEARRRFEAGQAALRATAERADQSSERAAAALRAAQSVHEEAGARIARLDELVASVQRAEEAQARKLDESRVRLEGELHRFDALFADFARRVEQTAKARVQEAGAELRRESAEEAERLRGEIAGARDQIVLVRDEMLGSLGELSTAAVEARRASADAAAASASVAEFARRVGEAERSIEAAGRGTADAAQEVRALGAEFAELKSALKGPGGPEALAKALAALRSATADEMRSLRAEILGRMEAESVTLQAAVADASRRFEERRQAASAEDARAARASEESLRRELASAKAVQEAHAHSSAAALSDLDDRLLRVEALASQANSAARRLDGLRESVETMERLPSAVRAEMAAVKGSLEKELRETLNRYLIVLEDAVRSVKR